MCCLPASITVALDNDGVNIEMHSKAVMEWVWRCTCMLLPGVLGDTFGRYGCANLEAISEQLLRNALRGHESANLNAVMDISKIYICPGGIAPSEWMHSVRAIRDTPVADYSVSSVKSMSHVPSHPQITVSRCFSFCRSPISIDHSGGVANCDHTSEWVHWGRACIRIAMRWVTLRQSLLAFLLSARKIQFTLY